ncbi:MAG: HPP family protein [Pseudomonadota bacterium]
MKTVLKEMAAYCGVELSTTSHAEKMISGLGALLGILSVSIVSFWSLRGAGAAMVLASMGASAVLLFVVPHGALSQPWPLVGGHLISALIGVTVQQWFPEHLWTPALAVALAIIGMQYLRCVHPPGGATALAAVIGGAEIHSLGYGYLLYPVLVNVLGILVVALLFNSVFFWRRYPAYLTRRKHLAVAGPLDRQLELTQEDFEAARQKLDTFIDVTTEELIELLELASRHAELHQQHPSSVQPGSCYSNGKLGRLWSVRQVIDENSAQGNRRKDEVIYKTLAGDGSYDTGICEREVFRQWARFEVVLRDGRWVKCEDDQK